VTEVKTAEEAEAADISYNKREEAADVAEISYNELDTDFRVARDREADFQIAERHRERERRRRGDPPAAISYKKRGAVMPVAGQRDLQMILRRRERDSRRRRDRLAAFDKHIKKQAATSDRDGKYHSQKRAAASESERKIIKERQDFHMNRTSELKRRQRRRQIDEQRTASAKVNLAIEDLQVNVAAVRVRQK
jgi:hypothetical protein